MDRNSLFGSVWVSNSLDLKPGQYNPGAIPVLGQRLIFPSATARCRMPSETYVVKRNDDVGRYVVAGQNLKAGQEIFTEEPFSIGPKAYTYLLCLACYNPLDPEDITLCQKCFWPVCSPECSENSWHKDYECEVFSSCGIKFQTDGDHSAQLECITPLRTLLASEKHSERWKEEIVDMAAHVDKRRNTEQWQAEQVNVVNFLRDKCKLERFTEEIIEKVCGILEVNAFEAVTRTMATLRGLYPKTALLNHNCIANTIHSIDPSNNFRLQLRTTVELPEGGELFSSYTSSLQPTMVRRARLRAHKYFDCKCPRCSDPTELGTHLGTLKCTKCDNGIITSTNPLDDDASWKCSHCDNGITGTGVQRVYGMMQDEMDRLETLDSTERLEASEKVLKSYKSVLHPRNAYNAALWHSLATLYGHAEGYTLDLLPDIILERKSKFCKDLLELLNVVEPGYTRIRGMVLYEYHVGLLLFSRSKFQYGEISSDALKQTAREVVKLLEECSQILSLEPAGSPEALLSTAALQSIAQLEESIPQLK